MTSRAPPSLVGADPLLATQNATFQHFIYVQTAALSCVERLDVFELGTGGKGFSQLANADYSLPTRTQALPPDETRHETAGSIREFSVGVMFAVHCCGTRKHSIPHTLCPKGNACGTCDARARAYTAHTYTTLQRTFACSRAIGSTGSAFTVGTSSTRSTFNSGISISLFSVIAVLTRSAPAAAAPGAEKQASGHRLRRAIGSRVVTPVGTPGTRGGVRMATLASDRPMIRCAEEAAMGNRRDWDGCGTKLAAFCVNTNTSRRAVARFGAWGTRAAGMQLKRGSSLRARCSRQARGKNMQHMCRGTPFPEESCTPRQREKDWAVQYAGQQC